MDNTRNDARILTKALNEIKATPFQVTAAATLLACVGLQSALEFVQRMDELNQVRNSMVEMDKEESK